MSKDRKPAPGPGPEVHPGLAPHAAHRLHRQLPGGVLLPGRLHRGLRGAQRTRGAHDDHRGLRGSASAARLFLFLFGFPLAGGGAGAKMPRKTNGAAQLFPHAASFLK